MGQLGGIGETFALDLKNRDLVDQFTRRDFDEDRRPGLLKAGYGLVELALLTKDMAQVAVGLGEVRIGLESVAKTLGRIFEFALFFEDAAQVIVGLGELRPQAQGLAIALGRIVQLFLLQIDSAQVVVGLGVLGPQAQALFQGRDGFVELLLFAKSVAEVVVGLGVIGIELQRLAQAGDRFVQPALLSEDTAKVVVGFGKVGPEPERLADIGDGQIAAAHLMIEHAKKVQGLDVPGVCLQNEAIVSLRFRQVTRLLEFDGLIERLRNRDHVMLLALWFSGTNSRHRSDNYLLRRLLSIEGRQVHHLALSITKAFITFPPAPIACGT